MPELPDVEGFRRHFARYGTGKPVVGVDVLDRELLRNATPQARARALKGRGFERASRHGKWLIAAAGGSELLLHFGMTGELHWSPGGDADRHVHDRVVFVCDGGELRYRNMRRFGGVWLARDPNAIEPADNLAARTQVPRRYLHKVLQDLVRAELVRSQPGPGGGYGLARSPASAMPARPLRLFAPKRGCRAA